MKTPGRALTATLVGLLAPTLMAQEPVFTYAFPDSWDGTNATVTDLSSAGNNGAVAGAPLLSNVVPPGAPVGSQSILTTDGGVRTDAVSLLNNVAVEDAGGFTFEVTFRWSNSGGAVVRKLIDYAGTEFLQIENFDDEAGTADLRFGFNDEAGGPTLSISSNIWYTATATFDTQGNGIVAGAIDGLATLEVPGLGVASEAMTKTSFGDSLGRPIGVGTFSASSGGLLEFDGNIFDANVALLPEPTSLLLLGIGAAVLRRR